MENSLGSKIAALRKGKMLKQSDVADKMAALGCSVNPTKVSKWETDYTEPSVREFLALCHVLDVKDMQWEFAGRHTGLLAGFNNAGRKKARELLDLLFKIEEYRDDPQETVYSKPRLLPLYDIAVSAGTGNFLEEGNFKMISVPDYVPGSADFALRISGNSMEPLYRDKQIIWVKEVPVVRDGEIGIFLYDGNAYCKIFVEEQDGVYLRSMNEAYDDIPVNENNVFKVFGKVVS